MPGNPLVRFDEGRVGRTNSVALSPTLLAKLHLSLLPRTHVNWLRQYCQPRFHPLPPKSTRSANAP